MTITLQVTVNVEPAEGGGEFDEEAAKKIAQEAVWNALMIAEDDGYEHSHSDEISILAYGCLVVHN